MIVTRRRIVIRSQQFLPKYDDLETQIAGTDLTLIDSRRLHQILFVHHPPLIPDLLCNGRHIDLTLVLLRWFVFMLRRDAMANGLGMREFISYIIRAWSNRCVFVFLLMQDEYPRREFFVHPCC